MKAATAPVAGRRARRRQPAATSIAMLRNLGPASARMLADAGIDTPAQLKRLGPVAAYVRVRRTCRGASLNLLYALEGALQGVDWRTVRRERRLELLTQLEDHERAHPVSAADLGLDLLKLRNIGPAMKRDFDLLGIRSCAQLARINADRLYLKLQRITATRHDPCVWDTFAAAIHQARTGEALPWWHFTRERKRRQAQGDFPTRTEGSRTPRSAKKAVVSASRRVNKRT
jgi:predicted flap endonuclease-1-like 5' DNA nuclease